jgi:hypothetical protein
MAKLDDEIDQLYRLPLSEFTKARDELAKKFEKDKARIRQLQKPNVAAWSVNQLFWRQRGQYEALIVAAGKARTAQLASLKGKKVDPAAAEAKHAEARRAALDCIRDILSDAGEALSPATISAVNETLEALPTDDRPGRLVRPLKPMGFEGLAGMLQGGTIALKRADVVPLKPKAAGAGGRETKPRNTADLRKEIQKLKESLREAKEAERVAASAHGRAMRALDIAKQIRDRTMQALDGATERLGVATRDLSDREKVLVAAAAAREAIEKQLELKKR